LEPCRRTRKAVNLRGGGRLVCGWSLAFASYTSTRPQKYTKFGQMLEGFVRIVEYRCSHSQRAPRFERIRRSSCSTHHSFCCDAGTIKPVIAGVQPLPAAIVAGLSSSRQPRSQPDARPESNPDPTFRRWLKDNARNGVELNRLLAQLRSKGFAAFANPEVMQWALATAGLDR